MQITDQFNRKINYLRFSVTDRCDLRCLYCMKEDMEFLPKNEILSLEEIERMCINFIDLGITKIRLTGGEPLVRKNLIYLINKLNMKKNITNLKEITLTTNGTLLKKYAKDLKNSGINRLNVSLDTINPEKYKKITRFGNLNNVLDGINEAIKNKIKVKINVVALQHFNDDEFETLIKWCDSLKIDITFIEVMPMEETDIARHLQFVPLNNVFDKLNSHFNFYKTKKNTGGPAIYYRSKKLSINVGFITPITHNFCESCNRIRMSSTGKLFMCLGQNENIDFRQILRKDFSDDFIKNKIKFALNIKPKKHDFEINQFSKTYVKRHMNVTGG